MRGNPTRNQPIFEDLRLSRYEKHDAGCAMGGGVVQVVSAGVMKSTPMITGANPKFAKFRPDRSGSKRTDV